MVNDIDRRIISDLLHNGTDFVSSVPCKQLAGVLQVLDQTHAITHIPCNKEDEGMGLCAGAFLGGMKPAIIMQNTALGVVVNTLATLIQFYHVPLPMLISYRGEVGEPVACQVEMALHTKAILNQLHIPTYHFHKPGDVEELADILAYANMCSKPVRHTGRYRFLEGCRMIRFDVLKSLVPVIRDELVVCNIGAPSQELCALDDRATNFYMLGTMGLASSIGFGLAVAQDKPVISIDGDGSVLTNLATLATIANNPRDNFILLIIDNGSYGSTGDQPTYTGRLTSLAAVARACGCENVVECSAAGHRRPGQGSARRRADDRHRVKMR